MPTTAAPHTTRLAMKAVTLDISPLNSAALASATNSDLAAVGVTTAPGAVGVPTLPETLPVAPAGSVEPPENADLTRREREVVRLVAQGMTSREVAAALYVTPKAISYHLGNVFAKLGVTSRRQLWGRQF